MYGLVCERLNLPRLEVIQFCSPHRALHPLRQLSFGGLTCLFVLGAAAGLPFATPFAQLFVPVFPSSRKKTSSGHDSSLSNSIETWLTHSEVVEAQEEVVETR